MLIFKNGIKMFITQCRWVDAKVIQGKHYLFRYLVFNERKASFASDSFNENGIVFFSFCGCIPVVFPFRFIYHCCNIIQAFVTSSIWMYIFFHKGFFIVGLLCLCCTMFAYLFGSYLTSKPSIFTTFHSSLVRE